MEERMFCYQCEQTAGCKGCSGKRGVCGKESSTAGLQDKLTGALVGLANAVVGNVSFPETDRVMMEGLFATLTNVNFDDDSLKALIDRVHGEKERYVPGCGECQEPCGRTEDFPMERLWKEENEDIRSLKSLLLFGLRGIAAYAYHSLVLGYTDESVNAFFYKGMSALGQDRDMENLLALTMEAGAVNYRCMELLDKANTDTYGIPAPVQVGMTVEKGPFIVISGHDLKDLKMLLEQTDGKGVNVYTHGEMLPAHAYPELKKYSHLKGNYGTAWQNQQKEFASLPAPILFTTNCIMPPKESYSDRVFTTGTVAYPGMVHVGEEKDFSAVIDKALELGGFSEDKTFTGINGGSTLTTGFGHHAILSAAGTVVEAVKSGDIRHFFLVGGCDGARTGRNYYTEFVQNAPKDSIILTLACGKYRFNDMELGEIGGLPRLMDMGQCNDAFGAVKVALALAKAFDCGVNELPLTLVLSWYEQKAVSILLTLLHLGIKNIYLGPTLPAFVSPNVLKYLVDNFQISPVSTPKEDLANIFK